MTTFAARAGVFLATLAGLAALASPARAEDPAPPPPATPLEKVVTPAVAVVPGVLVHGSGHWAAGDAETARTLLFMEGIGVASALGGVALLYTTGASRRLVAPSALLMIGGAGLFVTSFLADLYGSATGGARGEDVATGAPLTVLPAIESSLGYQYVYDPTFAYRSFVTTSLDARFGRFRVRPEGWFGAGHANERVRLLGSFRLSGPRPQAFDGKMAPLPAADGSFVDLELAGTRHAYPPELFTITSFEMGIASRLDLVRFARSLRGSFVEGSVGYGFANHAYAVEGAPSELVDQLLARFAFGMYLGRPRANGVYGETSLFYDHRHDGFAGGLKMRGLGSGAAGSFGARGLLWLSNDVGAVAEAQVGSALVLGISLLVRQPVTSGAPR